MAAIGKVKLGGQVAKREARVSDDGKKEFRSIHLAVVGATIEIRDVSPELFIKVGPEGGNVETICNIHTTSLTVANPGGKPYSRQVCYLELADAQPVKV